MANFTQCLIQQVWSSPREASLLFTAAAQIVMPITVVGPALAIFVSEPDAVDKARLQQVLASALDTTLWLGSDGIFDHIDFFQDLLQCVPVCEYQGAADKQDEAKQDEAEKNVAKEDEAKEDEAKEEL